MLPRRDPCCVNRLRLSHQGQKTRPTIICRLYHDLAIRRDFYFGRLKSSRFSTMLSDLYVRSAAGESWISF